MGKILSLGRGLLPILIASSVLGSVPSAAADVKRGSDLFVDNCGDCHSVRADGGNHKGPNLFGVVGRKSGSVAGFDYSDANKAAGWVWTPEQLDSYLAAPKTAMPGTVMKLKMPDPQERADIIAFLSTLHN